MKKIVTPDTLIEKPLPSGTERTVPLCRPSIGEAEMAAVEEVLHSGWMAHGDFNRKFESTFAQLIGTSHAITMNSCASALEVALRIAGIKGEVIVPAFTFVASANAIVAAGAEPVFCEIDPDTRNVTAETIAPMITPATEAIMVVHYGGQPCAMDGITKLCRKHGLFLLEDSAETLGAKWNGCQAGSFGTGCFSFFPTKNITTGEGGMLTCDDDVYAEKVRTFISHGIAPKTGVGQEKSQLGVRAAEMAGRNYRMSNVLAAIGYHQIQKLDKMNARRVVLAHRYDAELAALAPMVRTPLVAESATHVYQMYTIRVPATTRDQILHYLRANGIGASVHFDPPVHLQPYYMDRGGRPGQLPETEKLAKELITLPMFPDMTEEEQDWVIEALTDACRKSRLS